MSTRRTYRPWRLIARELTQETNPLRVMELFAELGSAFQAQGTGPWPPSPTELPLFPSPEQPPTNGDSKG